MAWFWLSVSVITFIWFLLSSKKRNRNLPPGPIGLPIVGHLHLLGKNLHRDLHRLSHKHGPIMQLRLGSVPAVVVSSSEAAELFLKTHDVVFAGRPHHQTSKYLCYDQRDIVFAPYGPYWRDMRKLCTQELLSGVKVNQFRAMRRAEVGRFVDALRDKTEIVDVSARVSAAIGDMTCLMVFGRKFVDKVLDKKGFKAVIDEMVEVGAAPNFVDFFPSFLAKLDFQGLDRKMKELSDTFDGFLERIIDDHVKNKREEKQSLDFVDTLMAILDSGEAGFDFDRRHVKAELIPFGSGRRGCPGMQLALTVVKLVVAQLVHCFDWELPDGVLPTDLDMADRYGLVTARDMHLMAIPTYRLRN